MEAEFAGNCKIIPRVCCFNNGDNNYRLFCWSKSDLGAEQTVPAYIILIDTFLLNQSFAKRTREKETTTKKKESVDLR